MTNAVEIRDVQTNWQSKGDDMDYGKKELNVMNPAGVNKKQTGEYCSVVTPHGGFTNANPLVTTGRTADGQMTTTLATHSNSASTPQKPKPTIG